MPNVLSALMLAQATLTFKSKIFVNRITHKSCSLLRWHSSTEIQPCSINSSGTAKLSIAIARRRLWLSVNDFCSTAQRKAWQKIL